MMHLHVGYWRPLMTCLRLLRRLIDKLLNYTCNYLFGSRIYCDEEDEASFKCIYLCGKTSWYSNCIMPHRIKGPNRNRNRNRNLKTSKALLKSQAHQGTSLYTSAKISYSTVTHGILIYPACA